MHKRIITAIVFSSFFITVQAQKGETSIAAGPLLSLPVSSYPYQNDLNNGIGLEATAQYSLSQKSALLLQLGLVSYSLNTGAIGYRTNVSLFSFKGGYRYWFQGSGFYANALAGITQSSDGYIVGSFSLGAGKRFILKDSYFIDAGIDLIGGDQSRINIKAAFSLLQRPKPQW